MSDLQPYAMITGASSGLGEEFARQLAKRGWNLILVARREERLNLLAAELIQANRIHVEVVPGDLSLGADIERVANVVRQHENLELLVNNAGFGSRGPFWDVALSHHLEMHQVHVMAALQLMYAFLKRMVPVDRGAIINVSSVAAYARSPGSANYGATKGWMNDISEGIYLDLHSRGSKIRIQALCPGFTYTEFHDTLGVSRDPIPKWLWLPAAYVVEESLRALDRGKLFVIPSFRYRLMTALMSKLPSALRVRLEQKSPHRAQRMPK